MSSDLLPDFAATSPDPHPDLVITFNPSEAEHAAILTPLRVFNDSTTSETVDRQKFAILLKDSVSGEITGGLYGMISLRWLYVDLLVVPQAQRGNGLGTAVMAVAEALARDRGLDGLWLYTYDFQALDFYLKLGFETFGQVDDLPPRGCTQYWLRKRLEAHS